MYVKQLISLPVIIYEFINKVMKVINSILRSIPVYLVIIHATSFAHFVIKKHYIFGLNPINECLDVKIAVYILYMKICRIKIPSI